MKKYIKEAPFNEAMNKLYVTRDVKPLQHTVYTGDFMLCDHDIACFVCFDASAVIERNLTPGKYSETVQPCRDCQQAGFRVRQMLHSRLINKLLGLAK